MTDSRTESVALSADERAELEYLRRHVANLESELREQARRTNATIAAAQNRSYWLDQWHLDLNAVMDRRGAAQLLAVARVGHRPIRFLRNLTRRLVRLKRRLLA